MKFQNSAGGMVEGFCIIKSLEKRTTARGIPYLDLTLADSEDEISAKLWEYNELLHGTYDAGELVKVRGSVTEYNGASQLRIDRIRKATQADGQNIADYVQSAEYDCEKMYAALCEIASQFADEQLSALVLYILEERKERLLYWPAAFRLHHAVRGGLLLHTMSIVRLAQAVCAIYPSVDADLLLAGAILHDIAKTLELDAQGTGIATGYTVEGSLIGHLAGGAMLVDAAAAKLGTDRNLAILLEHMLLSHHGEPEFGASVRPMFLEAELLAELDLMDARIFEMTQALAQTPAGEFSGRQWALDNRKLYRHNRKPDLPGVKLF